MDGQNLVNLSYGRIETGANFAGRWCLSLIYSSQLFVCRVYRYISLTLTIDFFKLTWEQNFDPDT